MRLKRLAYSVLALATPVMLGVTTPAGSASTEESKRIYAYPDVTTTAEMSTTDINRLVCKAGIKDIVVSQEKGVERKIPGGPNAFVKFLAKRKSDGQLEYASNPVELFVVCGDLVYPIVAVPKRIPPQTLWLSSPNTDKAHKNIMAYKGMPFEEKVLRIIKQVYQGDIPENFTATEMSQDVPVFKGAVLRLKRLVTIDGEGLRVKEYHMTMAVNPKLKGFTIRERDFLKPEIATRPVAVSIDKGRIAAGDLVRIIIVERATHG